VEIDESLLPPMLQELVRACGLRATMELVRHYGGVRIYVPERLDSSHPIVRVMGQRGARALSHIYARETISVPLATSALRETRRRRIRAEYGRKSAAQLAREHGLTERSIWRIVADGDTVDPQESLF